MWTDSPAMGTRRPLAVDGRDALLFIACYLALDWASYIFPLGPFDVTPWNPPPALSIVWLLLGGLRYAPVVFVAILAGELLIRHTPGGLALAVVTSLVLTLGYTGIVAALKIHFRFDGLLRNTRQLWMFIAVIALGAAIVGFCYVGVLRAAGFRVGDSFFAAVFQFWIGDTVGVLVTAPLLMVAADRNGRHHLAQSWRKPETTVQFALLLGLLFYMFQSGFQPQQYFYLLFLPLIWIASRNGLAGAVAASGLVQAGVVLGSQVGALQTLALIELQVLVSALTLTGLALGIIVDERARAVEDLKKSLRLAAAGEMAGAIAHEINQPLAALKNYGNACRIMLHHQKDAPPNIELNATIEKMIQESGRAAEVVGRVRDFFGSGIMRLEPVRVAALMENAHIVAARYNVAKNVTFRVEGSDAACTVLADRVQIELVLRNLVANAFEAVANLPSGERAVTVLARKTKGDRLLIRVSDSGDGIAPAVRQRLCEPFTTSKATGMGIGLAVSRAIAEAHGGSLDATSSRHGEFDLVLPIGDGDE